MTKSLKVKGYPKEYDIFFSDYDLLFYDFVLFSLSLSRKDLFVLLHFLDMILELYHHLHQQSKDHFYH